MPETFKAYIADFQGRALTRRDFRHGTNANKARPAWPGFVQWLGTVQPANAIVGDNWINVNVGEE